MRLYICQSPSFERSALLFIGVSSSRGKSAATRPMAPRLMPRNSVPTSPAGVMTFLTRPAAASSALSLVVASSPAPAARWAEGKGAAGLVRALKVVAGGVGQGME